MSTRKIRVIRLQDTDKFVKSYAVFENEICLIEGVQNATRFSMSKLDSKSIEWFLNKLSRRARLRGKLVVETYIHKKVETWTKVRS